MAVGKLNNDCVNVSSQNLKLPKNSTTHEVVRYVCGMRAGDDAATTRAASGLLFLQLCNWLLIYFYWAFVIQTICIHRCLRRGRMCRHAAQEEQQSRGSIARAAKAAEQGKQSSGSRAAAAAEQGQQSRCSRAGAAGQGQYSRSSRAGEA